MPCDASAMRAKPRLVPSASTAARNAGLSAAGLPVRRCVKRSAKPVQASTSLRSSVMRTRGSMPLRRIAELLSDVDAWTGFADRFTHLRTGNPAADKPALLAAVLADGTNLGLARMADASHGISYHHLVNVAQWHVSDDNYVAARAAVVNAHHKHPMAAIWDDGTTASSDGQYFRAGGRAGSGGVVNAKYGI